MNRARRGRQPWWWRGQGRAAPAWLSSRVSFPTLPLLRSLTSARIEWSLGCAPFLSWNCLFCLSMAVILLPACEREYAQILQVHEFRIFSIFSRVSRLIPHLPPGDSCSKDNSSYFFLKLFVIKQGYWHVRVRGEVCFCLNLFTVSRCWIKSDFQQGIKHLTVGIFCLCLVC